MYKIPGKFIFSSSLIILCLISGQAFAHTFTDSSLKLGYQEYSQVRQQNGIANPRAGVLPWASSTFAKNDLRSRSDVMNEVKKRYDAKVLKISLNSHTGIYNVRILLPNGKVRNIQISRKR
jgi:hypothetical protein